MSHQCAKKLRTQEVGTEEFTQAFDIWHQYYEFQGLRFSTKKSREEQFIASSNYPVFRGLVEHMKKFNVPNRAAYIDWLFRTQPKCQTWRDNQTFSMYIDWLLRNESPRDGMSRFLEVVDDWCLGSGVEVPEFFSAINPNAAAGMFATAKLSPWSIYVCDTSDKLLSRLNMDHVDVMGYCLDARSWNLRKKRHQDDVHMLKRAMAEIGL